MTGPEHYQEAEFLMEMVQEAQASAHSRPDDPTHLRTIAGRVPRDPAHLPTIAAAQVHAILALAAATAVNTPADKGAWRDVASIAIPGV